MPKRFRGLRWLHHAMRWLFGTPFQELPPAFGDTLPPELHAYEAEVDEMEHHPVGDVPSRFSHGHKRSKAAR